MPTPPARWAREARAKLVRELGGRCVKCGTEEDLELDHKNGRGWDLRKCNRWTRVARYRREAKLGLLQVLCRRCNAAKG